MYVTLIIIIIIEINSNFILWKILKHFFSQIQVQGGRYLFGSKLLLSDNFSEGYPVSNERWYIYL